MMRLVPPLLAAAWLAGCSAPPPITDSTVVDAWLQDIVDDGRVVGASAVVFEKGKETYFGTAGQADAAQGRAMARDDIFRIASMTKPVTGVALMTLYEDGLFELDHPLSDYVPEMANMRVFDGVDESGEVILVDPDREITVLDILRHTSGLPVGPNDGPEALQAIYAAAGPAYFAIKDLEDLAEVLGGIPLLYQPGTRWRYSLAVDIQALMVRRLSGIPFDDYLQETIFGPLGMVDTGHFVPDNKRERLVEIYAPGDDGNLVPHPDPGFTRQVTERQTLNLGGTGLVSTIDDYARFAQMLLSEGSLDGVEILRPETVRLMATNLLPADIGDQHFLSDNGKVGFGIDFAVRYGKPESDGWPYGVVGEYFWSGAAGTSFWIDPQNELFAILMTQRYPFDGTLLKEFRDVAYNRPERMPPRTQEISNEQEFPDVVRHSAVADPVQILNIFPEHGLTDPHVMIVDDRLYLGVGHDQSWDIEHDWTMDRWEIWSTADLREWRKETVISPEDTYFGPQPNCWAGDFAQKDGKYYWYFSNRNHDTGVMVADAPGGPYRDALGKPLLPAGLAPTHSYDPEVFEEDGTFSIIFGAVTYYVATLNDDMISLADEPEPVVVKTRDGEVKITDDKPTVFKRNGIYYLVWGAEYAMSDQLRGPYEYQGAFMAGGHGSIFEWQNQWYVIHPHHDISMFYRGIMLKPMVFNEDGTVNLDKDTTFPPGGGRLWDFDRSRMGWRAVIGTDVTWDAEGIIRGKFSGGTSIESANWSTTSLDGKMLRLRLKNSSDAASARISFAEFETDRPEFWKYPEIDWAGEASVVIDIQPHSTEFELYEVNLQAIENMPTVMKRLRIDFDESVDSGDWAIDYMRIE